MTKSSNALKTIGEVAKILDIPIHVIRFWEANFTNLKPVKYNNRRYYNVGNIELLKQIKNLLYVQKYSIKDAIGHFHKPRVKINILEKTLDRLVKAKKKLISLLQG